MPCKCFVKHIKPIIFTRAAVIKYANYYNKGYIIKRIILR